MAAPLNVDALDSLTDMKPRATMLMANADSAMAAAVSLLRKVHSAISNPEIENLKEIRFSRTAQSAHGAVEDIASKPIA